MIVAVGLSHKTAPLEVRERVAIGRDALPEVLRQLVALDEVGEAVVLSTCNRVEVYAAPRAGRVRAVRRGAPPDPWDADLEPAIRAVTSVLAREGGDAIAPHLVAASGRDAVVHLFRVASSLDSLVVGEPQILGQLKDAIDAAREAGTLGPTLGQAMSHAVRVGKRVRTQTAIGAGQVSVSSVAVDLARQIFGDLDGRSVALIGAGEMAEGAARLLVRAGARLVVVNRSEARAAELARDVGGEARTFAELERSVIEADVVVSSTASPGHVIGLDLVKRARKARKGRSLFLMDIAVPRDVDPRVNELDSVYLYDIDDLSQIVAESLEGRAAEADRAEAIVRDEARGFETWALERAMAPTIASLFARTRAVLHAEMDRSLSGKLRHLGPADREALAVMLDAAANKLLHAPTSRLRALAADPRAPDYLEALHDLFDLPDSDAPSGAEASRTPAGTREASEAKSAETAPAKANGARAAADGR